MLRAGDLLLEDRGFIDGATLSALKRQRQVDVIIPLKANMLATQEAMQLAEMARQVAAASLQGRPDDCPGARRGAYVDRV